jgi:hypothetical protein
MIPDSASGVSKQRSSPKVACSPSVTRNTPPSRPTSSPKISTLVVVGLHRVVQGGG